MTQKTLFPLLLFFSFATVMPRNVSPIFEEVRRGDTQAVKKRIAHCENYAQTDANGNTVLHVAAQEGQTEIVDILTSEPDYSSLSWVEWFGLSGYAATLPDKNGKNNAGDTPLHCALQSGHVDTADCLLYKKADPDIVNNEDISPVFSVIKQDNPHLLPFLSKYSLIRQKRKNGDNVLHYAIKENKIKTIERLAEFSVLTTEINGEGKTAAILATERNTLDILDLLRYKGVNLNGPGKYGHRPIHNAAMLGNYAVVKYLLKNNVFPDATDDDGHTPLHIAFIYNKEEIINLLLENGADSTKSTHQGKDIFAFAKEHRHDNLIERFKNHPHIDINGRDTNGQTPFMRATMRGDHLTMNNLTSFGAIIDTVDNHNENAFHKIARNDDDTGLQIIIKNNPHLVAALIAGLNNDGDSPLSIAARNGRLKVTKLYIYYGASLQGTNKDGETLLHLATKSKNTDVLKELLQNSNRPPLEARDKNDWTAFLSAAAHDNPDAMQELIRHGASSQAYTYDSDIAAHVAAATNAVKSLQWCQANDPYMRSKRNKYNNTPFLVAAENGKVEAVNFLVCEDDFISRDIGLGINLARNAGQKNMVNLLEQKIAQRLEECRKIAQQPDAIQKTQKDKDSLDNKISSLDFWHKRTNYQATVKRYSTDDLYYMRESERAQISLAYTKYHNELSQEKMRLEKILHSLEMKASKEKEKKRQEEEERKKILNEQRERAERFRREQDAEHNRLKKENEERVRAERERAEQEAGLKVFNDQHNEITRIKEQDVALKQCNENKKAEEEAQQKEFDHYAQQKAITDAAKHAELENQQPHVPFNLQASAPPMEELVPVNLQANAPKPVESLCKCGNKVPSKLLPCVICKKKIQNLCPQCIKNHNNGRCPDCWDNYSVEKREGECDLNFKDICTEQNGIIFVPCEHCQKYSSTARICLGCLKACIDKNEEVGLPHRCPHCRLNTLKQELLKKLFPKK